MNCLTCTNFTFRTGSEAWNRLAWGNCSHDAKFVMYAPTKERDCGKHNQADAETVEKREAYLTKILEG